MIDEKLIHQWLNSLRLRQNGRHFADDVFKWIFLNENVWISLKISLKFVPKVPINNIPALVQIMARRCPYDKPLSEPMMVNLLMHICVALPQLVNSLAPEGFDYSLKLANFKLIATINILSIFCEIAITTPHWSLVNIASGNGLVPSGNKPLPETMLT